MSAVEVLARHNLTGSTKFSHRGGSSYVEWPRCGCGWSDHPARHAQHLLDVLAEAGYTVTQAATYTPSGLDEFHPDTTHNPAVADG